MSASILIVDDEQPVRNLLEKILSQAGYNCKAAAGAAEARQYLNREAFDLILSDVMMPEESGIDFVRFASEAYPDTGIIMVTAVENPQEVEVAIDLGIYGYVVKPFSRSQILIGVSNALRHRKLDIQKRLYRKNLEEIVKERTAEYQETIGALKKAQEELRISENKFTAFCESSKDVMYFVTKEGRFIWINKAGTEKFGYSEEEFESITIGDFCQDISDRPKILAQIDKKGFVDGLKVKYKTKDGRPICALITASARKDPQGNIIGYQGIIRDITRFEATRKQLRRSEEMFRKIATFSSDAIIMTVHGGRITFWNPAAEKIFGYTAKEAMGRTVHGLIIPPQYRDHPGEWTRFFEISERDHAMEKNTELTVVRKDGTEFFVEHSPTSIQIDGVWHAVSVFRDISERKRADDALRRAHQDMDAMVKAITSIIIEVAADGRIHRWNDAASKTFGITTAEVLGKSLFDCGITLDCNSLKDGISSCIDRGQNIRMDDVSFSRPDGRNGFLGIALNPIFREEDQVAGILIMGADITERKHLESQLVQAQKLESLGQLAAGIAHEINTPTQYVGDNTRFLQDAFGDLQRVLTKHGELLESVKSGKPTETLINEVESVIEEADLSYLTEEIPKAIGQTLEGVERVAKIVRSMKEFSHPGGGEKTAYDINRALETTITVARNEWKYVAEMETDFDSSLPLVPCLPGELNQVFLNMIINAAHAISDEVGDGENGKGTIRIQTALNCESAEIRISDTGSGIPENIGKKIFDPFFTTKAVGKGTGQGLAISHTVIVEKHGGSLSFETEKGKGTTFIIRLPLDPASERMIL